MAETANIAAMAEKISQEIFSEFGWQTFGPFNENCECALSELHKLKTHPSDVVFYYQHPYSNKTVYINTDLKSYGSDSINKATMAGAISSLAKAVECCQVSSTWQSLYTIPSTNKEIVGLLFIYNHDGNYDKNFNKVLYSIHRDNFKIRKGSKFVVIGPEAICYLKTLAHDIKILRGDGILPNKEDYYFYYPELYQKKLVRERNRAATIETLCGPWQMIRYKIATSNDGLLVYLRSRGETLEEFLYFIDYLFSYQLIQNMSEIRIRVPYADNAAISNFQRAKAKYAMIIGSDGESGDRLNKLTCESITTVHTQYSSIEIGMRNA